MAILVGSFSVYMTKLYETQASVLSIVDLLHDYSFFIITVWWGLVPGTASSGKAVVVACQWSAVYRTEP